MQIWHNLSVSFVFEVAPSPVNLSAEVLPPAAPAPSRSRLAEVLLSHPSAVVAVGYDVRCPRSVGALKGRISRIAPDTLNLNSLDELWERRCISARFLLSLLEALPPRVLTANFGLEPVIWRAVRGAEYPDRSSPIGKVLEEAGVDPEDLALGRAIACDGNRAINAYRMVSLLTRHTREILPDLGLSSLIPRFCRPGHRSSPEDFSLHAIRIPNREGKLLLNLTMPHFPPTLVGESSGVQFWRKGATTFTYAAYLDAPLALVLRHRGEPCALMAFELHRGDTLFIRQLQGLNGRSISGERTRSAWALEHLDWPELLLTAATRYARASGLGRVELLGSKNNIWVKRGELSPERAHRIYDEAPWRVGFYELPRADWYLPIHHRDSSEQLLPVDG